jgi:hypothetical protein
VRQNPYLQIRVHWMSRPAAGAVQEIRPGNSYDAKRELVRSWLRMRVCALDGSPNDTMLGPHPAQE